MNIYEQYIKDLETGGKSIHTIRVYSKDLNKFLAFSSADTVEKISAMKVDDFRKFVASQDMLPSSLNGLLRSLSAFFSWLVQTGQIETVEFFNMKFGRSRFVKVPKTKKVILTAEEVDAVIKAGADVQTRFMLALMLFTGIRREEVCNIKLSDINGCKILINGKGSKQRVVFLNDTLCAFMSLYMTERERDTEYLFYGRHGVSGKNGQMTGTSVNNRVKTACRAAGIDEAKLEKLSAHKLRATALSAIIRQFGIQAAQKVAGHSSITTTMIYDGTGDEVVENALMNLKMGNGG